MRGIPFLLLLSFAISVSSHNSTARTNRPASIILPPPDWDSQTHALAPLIKTNKPGIYPLPNSWVGVEKVTARTGWYAREFEKRKQTNEWIEFDQFSVSSSPVQKRMGAERAISSRGQDFPQAGYRTSLPSDVELLSMTNALSVSNLFGWNPFSSVTNSLWNAISVRYFTLRPYDSIEMLQVTFMKRANESNIESILVKRSRLHRQP